MALIVALPMGACGDNQPPIALELPVFLETYVSPSAYGTQIPHGTNNVTIPLTNDGVKFLENQQATPRLNCNSALNGILLTFTNDGAPAPFSSLAVVPSSSTTSSAASSSFTTTAIGTSTSTSVSSITSGTSSTASTLFPAASGVNATISGSAPKQNKNLSSGAAAGIGIACLVAGLAIGALAIFLLCGRRKSKTRPGYAESNYPSTEKGAVANARELGPVGGVGIVERNLPDPIADSDISAQFSRLEGRIDGHVASYYAQSNPIDHEATAQSIYSLISATSPLSAAQIASSLEKPQGRLAFLRAAIAHILISRMDLESDHKSSLLPAGAAASLQGMPKRQQNDPVHNSILLKWRAMTSHLMGLPHNEAVASEEAINGAVMDCDRVIGQYASPASDQQARLHNLEEITRRASRVAGMLFSQPAIWRFDWQNAGPGLVVFPALVKVSDEHGNGLQQPHVFEPKKVVQI
ncbi:hypothetical protein BT63DRAFT_420955 [Microthyrium microscopicum]|uniref:Uncharacterized protein n=1 Tax=Microthyrium microscopicum TaxID=703497 RepID=A0A6A6UMR4_9PEZI|nr:hypothetical protein BT63DRAFT_420955 [Microthyrium microscopicum]